MDDFRRNTRKLQDNTIESIEDEYRSLLNFYRNRFSMCIKDIIEEEFRGIPESKMDDWIEEMLIDEIRRTGIHQIRKMHNFLEENNNDVIRGISSGSDSNRLLSEYENQLNRYSQRDDSGWLEEIIMEFRYSLINKLSYYCDVFNGISESNIENKIDSIGYEIKPRLMKVAMIFMDEYKQIIKKEFNKNINKMQQNVEQFQIVEKIPENVKEEFAESLKYSGYDLIEENTKLYVVEIKTGNKFEVRYNEKNNILSSLDDSLVFQITKDYYQSINLESNKIIVINNNSFQTCNKNKKYHLAILQKEDGYEFYYGGKKVTDIVEIDIIIDRLKHISPEYYNKLLNDPSFGKIVDDAKKHDEDSKEIYLDEADGKVKINPNNKENVIKKLRLFGYTPLEKEDGLYIKNLQTNEEQKVKYTNGFCLVEGLKSWEFNLSTSSHYVLEDRMMTSMVKIDKGSASFYGDNELSSFTVFIGDIIYKINLTEDGIKTNVKNRNNLPLYVTDKEILSRIKMEFPYLVEHIERHIEKLNGTVSFQNISEQRELLEKAKESLLNEYNEENSPPGQSPKR